MPQRRPPAHCLRADQGRPRRDSRVGHRRRHRAGEPREDLRPVLHDQAARHRHRPVARVPHAFSCTTATSTSSRRPGSARRSSSRCRRRGQGAAPSPKSSNLTDLADEVREPVESTSCVAVRQLIVLVIARAPRSAAGCAKVQARTEPEMPLLAPPPPPPRVVETYVDEPVPTMSPARRRPRWRRRRAPPARPPATRREPPRSPNRARTEPERPAAAAARADAEAGARRRDQDRGVDPRAARARAAQDLNRVNYTALNADGRAQYDTARRFMQQAEEALKGGNSCLRASSPTRRRRWPPSSSDSSAHAPRVQSAERSPRNQSVTQENCLHRAGDLVNRCLGGSHELQ